MWIIHGTHSNDSSTLTFFGLFKNKKEAEERIESYRNVDTTRENITFNITYIPKNSGVVQK